MKPLIKNNKRFLSKLLQDTPCLTPEQMIGYFEDRLPDKEKLNVERHLVDCPLCSEALQRMEALPHTAALQEMVKSVDEKFTSQNQFHVSRSRRAFLHYSIAAALLLAVGSIFIILNHKPKNERLFAAFFRKYDVVIPMTRTEGPVDSLQQALVFYEKSEYQKGLSILEQVLENDSLNVTAHFYTGISLLFLDDADQSIYHLEHATHSEDTKFKEHGLWYTGLAYLKKNDLEKAGSIFQDITANKWYHWEQSKKILEEIIK